MTKIEPACLRQFSLVLLWRGFCKTCPKCREGAVLEGYLKPKKSCAVCNEDFSHISADDGPAWLTLHIVGHALVTLMLIFGRNELILLWMAIFILVLVALVSVYFVLPRAKGIFIALIWLTAATVQNQFSKPTDPQD